MNLIKANKPSYASEGWRLRKVKKLVGQDIADELKLVEFVDEKSTTQTIEKIQQGN